MKRSVRVPLSRMMISVFFMDKIEARPDERAGFMVEGLRLEGCGLGFGRRFEPHGRPVRGHEGQRFERLVGGSEPEELLRLGHRPHRVGIPLRAVELLQQV